MKQYKIAMMQLLRSAVANNGRTRCASSKSRGCLCVQFECDLLTRAATSTYTVHSRCDDYLSIAARAAAEYAALYCQSYLPQRIYDGPVAIDSDRGQREHGHIHANQLHVRTEGAHELGQYPALQDGRMKLRQIERVRIKESSHHQSHSRHALIRLAVKSVS